jgi:hypothetical protein
MKKFLLKILIFSVLLWAIGFTYQSIIDEGLKEQVTDGNVGWINIYNQQINQDVVILGSSRAWVQINPKIIEDEAGLSCFNLGLDGARFQMQRTRWKTLLAQGNKPKLIIQVVDYFALNPRINLYKKERFMPYLNDWNMYEPLTHIDSSIWMDRYLPPMRYHGYDKLQSIGWKSFFDLHLDDDEKPWHRRYNGFKGTKDSIKVEPTYLDDKQFETYVDNKKIDFGREALSEMIEAFQAENIPVILLNLPIYHRLRNSIVGRDQSTKLFEDVATKYQIEFWDMSEDTLGNNIDLFADPLHMNSAGADKITLQLTKKILEYNKRQ